MSLVSVNTGGLPIKISGTEQLGRLLKEAVASEMDALNLYSTLIEACTERAALHKIAAVLNEIYKDECNHAGKLLYCLREFCETDEDWKVLQNGLERGEE